MLLKNSLSLHQNTLLNFSLFVPSKLEVRNTFVSFLRDFSPLKRDEVERRMETRSKGMRNSAAKSASFYWRGSRLFPFRKARVSPTRLAAVQTWNVKTRRGFTRVTPTRRDVSKRARIAATLDAFQRNRVSKPEPRPSRPFPVPLHPSISLLVFDRSSSDQHFPRLVTRRRKPPFLLFRERLLRMLR